MKNPETPLSLNLPEDIIMQAVMAGLKCPPETSQHSAVNAKATNAEASIAVTTGVLLDI